MIIGRGKADYGSGKSMYAKRRLEEERELEEKRREARKALLASETPEEREIRETREAEEKAIERAKRIKRSLEDDAYREQWKAADAAKKAKVAEEKYNARITVKMAKYIKGLFSKKEENIKSSKEPVTEFTRKAHYRTGKNGKKYKVKESVVIKKAT